MGIIQKVKEKILHLICKEPISSIPCLGHDVEYYYEVDTQTCAPHLNTARKVSNVLQGYAIAQAMSQDEYDNAYQEAFGKPWTVDDIVAEFKEEEK